MVTEQKLSDKQGKVFIALLICFTIFAISAIGFALLKVSLLLYPMTVFGICALVLLCFYIALMVKQVNESRKLNKKPVAKPSEKKEDDPLSA
jgi:hypothetical protein